jgi:hypothetical protein
LQIIASSPKVTLSVGIDISATEFSVAVAVDLYNLSENANGRLTWTRLVIYPGVDNILV